MNRTSIRHSSCVVDSFFSGLATVLDQYPIVCVVSVHFTWRKKQPSFMSHTTVSMAIWRYFSFIANGRGCL